MMTITASLVVPANVKHCWNTIRANKNEKAVNLLSRSHFKDFIKNLLFHLYPIIINLILVFIHEMLTNHCKKRKSQYYFLKL